MNLIKLTPIYQNTQHSLNNNSPYVTNTLSNTHYKVWRKKHIPTNTYIFSSPFTEVKCTASYNVLLDGTKLIVLKVNYNFTKTTKELVTTNISKLTTHLDLAVNKYFKTGEVIFNTTNLAYINIFWHSQLFKYVNLHTIKLVLKHLRLSTDKQLTPYLLKSPKDTPLLLTLCLL